MSEPDLSDVFKAAKKEVESWPDWKRGATPMTNTLTHELLDELERFCGDDTCRLPKAKKNVRLQTLISAAREGLNSRWLPIEEAPKDGTVLLLIRAGYDERAFTGAWSVYSNKYSGPDHWTDCCRHFNLIEKPPTHFMPLPTPPEGA